MPFNNCKEAIVDVDPSVQGKTRSGPVCIPSRPDNNAEKKRLKMKSYHTAPEQRHAGKTKEMRRTEHMMAKSPHIIVAGGQRHDSPSLKSVEGYIINEERWIILPEMNIPRYFHSSVVINNEVVVSGGDTGPGRTDTIEILDLDETPVQWITSDAKLPVPLCAHKTVAREGKLIVIGGNDNNDDPGTGGNSNKIYEVDLAHPYPSRILCNLPQPMSWHGAEMIDDKIFIFGGGRSFSDPYNQILVYDIINNTCLQRVENLPYRVQGMATIFWGNRVLLLGGVDAGGQELNTVISYDVNLGRTRPLRAMQQPRGGCTAVIHSPNSGPGVIVALGSMENVNTVERCVLRTDVWSDMPPTLEARQLCTSNTAFVS